MLSLDLNTGNHSGSYIANVDVAERQGIQRFLWASQEVVHSNCGAEFISGSRGDDEVFGEWADEVRWANWNPR